MMLFKNKYRLLFVTGLSLFTFINTEFCQLYEYFGIPVQWYNALLVIFLATLACWEINRLLQPLFNRPNSLFTDEWRKLVAYFLVATTVSIVATWGIVAVFHYWIIGKPRIPIYNPIKLSLIYIVLANLLFHLLHAVVLYQTRFRNKMLEAEQLRSENIQAQLMAIKSQINPHFLFNNLNVLSSLVMQESHDANRFIEEFSKVYQYILTSGEKEMVMVEKELEFLRPYTFLLQKRFGEALHIEFDIKTGHQSHYIIPISLQLLIENAIKHNVVSRNRPLTIHIHSNGNDTLVISNNLQPKQHPEPSTQTGLRNISKRYRFITGRDIDVDKTENHFTVTLPLFKIRKYAGAYS
jgi:two-component system, LytTR family, sensor kinase